MILHESLWIIFLPASLLIFYLAFKKSWVDNDLRKSAIYGLIFGCLGVGITKLLYFGIEYLLGTNLTSFVTHQSSWWMLLIVSIGIVGFIEEGIKAAMSLSAAYFVSFLKRPSSVFISFASCGIGFSIIENLQYYLLYGQETLLPRLIISSSGHLFFSCICGVIAAEGISIKKSATTASVRIFTGIFAAALAHGIFDFMIFKLNPNSLDGMIICISAFFIYSVHEFWTRILRHDIQKSDSFMMCHGCGAFAIGKGRFCNFCGQRLAISPTKLEIHT